MLQQTYKHQAYIMEFEYVKCMCNITDCHPILKMNKLMLSDVTCQWAQVSGEAEPRSVCLHHCLISIFFCMMYMYICVCVHLCM